jgi:hypothetical protein
MELPLLSEIHSRVPRKARHQNSYCNTGWIGYQWSCVAEDQSQTPRPHLDRHQSAERSFFVASPMEGSAQQAFHLRHLVVAWSLCYMGDESRHLFFGIAAGFWSSLSLRWLFVGQRARKWAEGATTR